jgi:hypothetical protein
MLAMGNDIDTIMIMMPAAVAVDGSGAPPPIPPRAVCVAVGVQATVAFMPLALQ